MLKWCMPLHIILLEPNTLYTVHVEKALGLHVLSVINIY